MIKVFIDQGHNPTNPNAGAEGNGLREQDLVYEIGVQLAELLNSSPDFEAKLSRNSPDEILGATTAQSLRARTDAANDWGADIFISLHANASNLTGASGSEGLVYTIPSAAYTLSEDLLTELSNATGLQNRGTTARPGLYVLRKTKMPAVLVELGFITNAGDAALMNDRPELFARGLYEGIKRYFRIPSDT